MESQSRKQRHNDKVRARILEGAGRLFRVNGYDGTGIDALMAEAGLTRGAFYAHFRSKDDLFVAVVTDTHPLLRKLQTRDGDADALWRGLMEVFAAYLSPGNFAEVSAGCSMAALGRDVARAGKGARRAYEAAFAAILHEIARGQGFEPRDPACVAALTLALGAVAAAAATENADLRDQILIAAHRGFALLANTARRRDKDEF